MCVCLLLVHLQSVAALLVAARGAGVPVVHLREVFRADGADNLAPYRLQGRRLTRNGGLRRSYRCSPRLQHSFLCIMQGPWTLEPDASQSFSKTKFSNLYSGTTFS